MSDTEERARGNSCVGGRCGAESQDGAWRQIGTKYEPKRFGTPSILWTPLKTPIGANLPWYCSSATVHRLAPVPKFANTAKIAYRHSRDAEGESEVMLLTLLFRSKILPFDSYFYLYHLHDLLKML